jgi:hypothetical protein
LPSITKLTRDQLNEKALKLGIADAVQMPNRKAVIEAIKARKSRPQGSRLVSVFANGRRALVEMHVDRAREEFGDQPLAEAGGSIVVEATQRQLAEIRERKPDVADSALAAAALQMAYELDHPFNSATSKSMCAKALHQAMDRLLELAPPGKATKGKLDELKERRRKTAGRAAA